MRDLLKGDIDFETDDIRVALIATNGAYDPGDTAEDPATISAMNGGAGLVSGTTEFDGTGYSRKALSNESVTEVTGSDQCYFDADDVTWTSLSAGTYGIEGALIYLHVTNDSDSVPIAWCPYSADQTPNGSDFTTTWPSGGIITIS